MKRSQVSKDRDNALMHSVEGVTDKGQNARDINRPSLRSAAFSLVELTLALGVAAFCLLVLLALLPTGLKTQRTSVQQTTAADIITEILADLRADVRLPPGQVSKEEESGFGLKGHWALIAEPDTLFFTNNGQLTGTVAQGDPAAPAEAVFRVKITYLSPPNASTSAAKVMVTWPAQAIPGVSTPAGAAETFIAVNR
jgi:type II secretory pathway pseudopilin PulG